VREEHALMESAGDEEVLIAEPEDLGEKDQQ
jgi:hypothetical protein